MVSYLGNQGYYNGYYDGYYIGYRGCVTDYYRFQFFNGEYHATIEIVECESGQIAQKWSSAGRICGCRSISSQPNMYITFILHEQNYGIKSPKGNNPLKLVIPASQKN